MYLCWVFGKENEDQSDGDKVDEDELSVFVVLLDDIFGEDSEEYWCFIEMEVLRVQVVKFKEVDWWEFLFEEVVELEEVVLLDV